MTDFKVSRKSLLVPAKLLMAHGLEEKWIYSVLPKMKLQATFCKIEKIHSLPHCIFSHPAPPVHHILSGCMCCIPDHASQSTSQAWTLSKENVCYPEWWPSSKLTIAIPGSIELTPYHCDQYNWTYSRNHHRLFMIIFWFIIRKKFKTQNANKKNPAPKQSRKKAAQTILISRQKNS